MKFDLAAMERLRATMRERPAIEITSGAHRRAAVVAPFIHDGDSWRLLFVRRSETLTKHSGQVAFPGGGADPDEVFHATALREMEEEVGVPPSSIELIGRLDDLVTISGFVVAPFVGIIHTPPAGYTLQASEVTEVYEVPVEVLLEPRNPQVRYVEYRNRDYPAYFYQHGELEIWGLTGRIVKALLDLVIVSR